MPTLSSSHTFVDFLGTTSGGHCFKKPDHSDSGKRVPCPRPTDTDLLPVTTLPRPQGLAHPKPIFFYIDHSLGARNSHILYLNGSEITSRDLKSILILRGNSLHTCIPLDPRETRGGILSEVRSIAGNWPCRLRFPCEYTRGAEWKQDKKRKGAGHGPVKGIRFLHESVR